MNTDFFARLVNGSFGDPALYVSLAHQNQSLLFDCGDLHPLTPKACMKVQTLFISHAHIDHLVGFDSLLRYSLNRDLRLQLFGPPGLVDCIEQRLGGYTWNLVEDFPLVIEVTEYAETFGRRAEFSASKGFVRNELSMLDQRDGWLCQTPVFRVRAAPLTTEISSLWPLRWRNACRLPSTGMLCDRPGSGPGPGCRGSSSC